MTAVANPADFKYCIDITTFGGKQCFALTNDTNITYGDVMATLLHEIKYKLTGSSTQNFNLYFSHDEKPIFTMTDKIKFKDNQAKLRVSGNKKFRNYESVPSIELFKSLQEDFGQINKDVKYYREKYIKAEETTKEKLNKKYSTDIKNFKEYLHYISQRPTLNINFENNEFPFLVMNLNNNIRFEEIADKIKYINNLDDNVVVSIYQNSSLMEPSKTLLDYRIRDDMSFTYELDYLIELKLTVSTDTELTEYNLKEYYSKSIKDILKSNDINLKNFEANFDNKRIDINKSLKENKITYLKKYSEIDIYEKPLSSECLLYVKSLTGAVHEILISLDETTETLKARVQDACGVPPDQQRLIHAGIQLMNNEKLIKYNLQAESTLHMVLRLRGGMLHETSGRNGDYAELSGLYFSLDNRPSNYHRIPNKPHMIPINPTFNLYNVSYDDEQFPEEEYLSEEDENDI